MKLVIVAALLFVVGCVETKVDVVNGCIAICQARGMLFDLACIDVTGAVACNCVEGMK